MNLISKRPHGLPASPHAPAEDGLYKMLLTDGLCGKNPRVMQRAFKRGRLVHLGERIASSKPLTVSDQERRLIDKMFPCHADYLAGQADMFGQPLGLMSSRIPEVFTRSSHEFGLRLCLTLLDRYDDLPKPDEKPHLPSIDDIKKAAGRLAMYLEYAVHNADGAEAVLKGTKPLGLLPMLDLYAQLMPLKMETLPPLHDLLGIAEPVDPGMLQRRVSLFPYTDAELAAAQAARAKPTADEGKATTDVGAEPADASSGQVDRAGEETPAAEADLNGTTDADAPEDDGTLPAAEDAADADSSASATGSLPGSVDATREGDRASAFEALLAYAGGHRMAFTGVVMAELAERDIRPIRLGQFMEQQGVVSHSRATNWQTPSSGVSWKKGPLESALAFLETTAEAMLAKVEASRLRLSAEATPAADCLATEIAGTLPDADVAGDAEAAEEIPATPEATNDAVAGEEIPPEPAKDVVVDATSDVEQGDLPELGTAAEAVDESFVHSLDLLLVEVQQLPDATERRRRLLKAQMALAGL